MTKRRLFKAVENLDVQKKDLEYEIPGVLGFTLNGENTVEVPTRNSFVYVRLRNNQNELIQAFNDQVSPVYGLPVLVTRDRIDKSRYKVVGRDLGQYQNWGGNNPYMVRHGNQHSFNPDSGGGGDIVWVFGRQFMPLLGYPSGSSASAGIIVHSYTYYDGSSWNYIGNTGTADLTTYKPTGSNARIVLVYIDESGNPNYEAGSYFDASITGVAEIVPYIPNPPTGTAFPVSAVRLVSGTSTISWGNLYDVRPFYDLSGTSSGLGGAGGGAPDDASYITLGLDTDLLAERQLTTGTHTTVTDGGANGTVAINVSPQGAGSGLDADSVDGWDAGDFASGSHNHYQGSILDLEHALVITEDSVFQVTGTAIDFGTNMNVAVTGSVVFVSSIDTVGGGGGGDLLIYDDSVFNVTGTAISFDDNLTVHVTGSIAYIEATGATGSAGAAGPPGDNTLLIYEDDVFEVTGTSMSFGSNMDVVVTGSVAFVSSTGGGGGNSTYTDDWDNRPSGTVNDGDLFFPQDGFTLDRVTGSSSVYQSFGPIFQFTSPAPIINDFTWINQESGGSSGTVSVINGGITLSASAHSGQAMRIRKKSAPSVPYSIEIFVLPLVWPINYSFFSFGWRDSSTGELAHFRWGFNSGVTAPHAPWSASSVKSNSPSADNAVYGGYDVSLPEKCSWIRIRDDNTNRYIDISVDGVTWLNFHTVTRLDFLTPDEVFFAVDARNSSRDVYANLLHWKES